MGACVGKDNTDLYSFSHLVFIIQLVLLRLYNNEKLLRTKEMLTERKNKYEKGTKESYIQQVFK